MLCVLDGCCLLALYPAGCCLLFVGVGCVLFAVRSWLMLFGDCRVLFKFMRVVCVVCALLVVACCSLFVV